MASPSFFRDLVRVIASANVGWIPNVMPADSQKLTWLPYGLYKIGISVGSFIYQLPIRVSGSAELVLITPHRDISSKKVIVGTHGAMDIEFFVNPKRSSAVFVNLGGMGLFSPKADKLQGQPTFANGFTTSFGYRYYF